MDEHRIWTGRSTQYLAAKERALQWKDADREIDGKVDVQREVGFMTYIWISPDSEFVVAFSDSIVFTEREKYNLLVYATSKNLFYKASIRHDSPRVGCERIGHRKCPLLLSLEEPDIKIEQEKGWLKAISFLNLQGKRCRVPLSKPSQGRIAP
ncbi:MAG: hypothetical protein R3F11_14325 [Verrucomicrobiales bacterium]